MTSAIGSPQTSGPFHEISRVRCEELLASRTVGRVAWNSADGPQLLPVTYAMFKGQVVFRTSPYGVLSQLVRPCKVVFEVDELDHSAATGWSVLVHGTAHGVGDPPELVELWTVDGLIPWAAGVRNLFIAIAPRTISGRTVAAPNLG